MIAATSDFLLTDRDGQRMIDLNASDDETRYESLQRDFGLHARPKASWRAFRPSMFSEVSASRDERTFFNSCMFPGQGYD